VLLLSIKPRMDGAGVKSIGSRQDYDELVGSAGERMLVIAAGATMSRSFRSLEPIVDKLSTELTNVVFAKLDASEMDDLALELGVKALPALAFVRGGRLLDTLVAAKPGKVEQIIRDMVGEQQSAQDSSAAPAAGSTAAAAPRERVPIKRGRSVEEGGVVPIRTERDFELCVRDAPPDVPVVVKYKAPWCRNCKRLSGPVARLAAELAHARFFEVDTSELEDLALAQGVAALPCVHLWRGGQSVGVWTGSKAEAMEKRIREHAGVAPVAAPAAAAAAGMAVEETDTSDGAGEELKRARSADAGAGAAAGVSGLSLSVSVLWQAAEAGALNVPVAPGGLAVDVTTLLGPDSPSLSPAALASSLQRRVLSLYARFLSGDGRHVDYEAMKQDPEFAAYVGQTTLLAALDLKRLEPAELKAFCLNVYNALTIHGTVVHGPPGASLSTFFGQTRYLIGGLIFSLDDLEHGILRGNQVHPTKGTTFFAQDDPRAALALPLDPRIHFALVCGAKSCPPIRHFNASNLDTALTLAARAFCDAEVEVDEAARKVTTSKILSWYGNDFGKTTSEQLAKVATFMSDGPKKAALQRLLAGGEVTLAFRDYDWGSNAKEAL